MRTVKFIIFLLISAQSFGQSTLDTKYSADVCSCLDSLKKIGLTEQNFQDCFLKAMQQNSDLILQETKEKYGDTSEASGYRFGKELSERITISLVRDCKTYFTLTDSLRYEDYRNLNHDSLRLQLSNLNKIEASLRNSEFYSNEALILFELKNYDSSLSAIEKSLKLNSNNYQSLYIKGWINEIKGNYAEAISLYDKVAELTHMNSFYIFSEVAKRKRNGM